MKLACLHIAYPSELGLYPHMLLCLRYFGPRTALLRAAACIQLELDATAKSGVHVYSMHPGGSSVTYVQDLEVAKTMKAE